MRGKKLTEHESDFVSGERPSFNVRGRSAWRWRDTNLNKALSSKKPDAKASTASSVPMFLKANIARYRSKSGKAVSVRETLRDSMLL
jgi:hypothetical protein